MLFRLKRVAKKTETNLGYKWIEVLSAEPFALTPARKEHDYKFGLDGPSASWAAFGVSLSYVCRTECGLVKISEGDLWPEIDAKIYVEDKKGKR